MSLTLFAEFGHPEGEESPTPSYDHADIGRVHLEWDLFTQVMSMSTQAIGRIVIEKECEEHCNSKG